MKTSFTTFALAVLVTAGSVMAAEPISVDRAEFEALRDEVTRLRAQGNETWLNERRTEEVKPLVRDVLSDADTRASMAEGGMTAGHNGKHFFLASEDGGFLMEIFGQIQFRYIWNMRDNSTDDVDDDESGFVLARTRIGFAGHIADPRLHYYVELQVDRATNDVQGHIITIGYDITDTLTIRVGEDKGPFTHEELVNSRRQLAVERSLVGELFSLGVVQGIFLDWDAHEQVHLAFAVSDGGRSGDPGSSAGTDDFSSVGRIRIIDLFSDFDTDPDDNPENVDGDSILTKDFHGDGTDVALTGRVDLLLAGSWAQNEDFTSWPGEELFVRVGGAVHYEINESGDPETDDADDFLMWTVDAAVEYRGLNLFAAFMMAHTDHEEDGSDDYDPWGLVVQLGYNIDLGNGDSIEPFARYEHLDLDGAVDDGDTVIGTGYPDEIDLVTVGVNWYHAKHNAKFTADVVCALDPIASDISDSGQGVLTDENDDDDDQLVVRLQYQLLF